jgi:FKBP-type peptidyl-prolyl cis-trans isomerase
MSLRASLWPVTISVLLACAWPVGADDDPEPPGRMVTTRSGLKYKDTKAGKGDPAKKGDYLTVHYTGWLCVEGKKGKKASSLARGG